MSEQTEPTLAQALYSSAHVKIFNATTFKKARLVMAEASDSVAELRRLLHFAITHSSARHLFNESFIEDAEAILEKVKCYKEKP